MEEPVLKLGRQQQWEAVPPYQLLESAQTTTPQDPRACSGLLVGTRCSKADTSLQLSITQNYQPILLAQIAVKKSSYCSNPLKTLPYCFPSFLNEFPE